MGANINLYPQHIVSIILNIIYWRRRWDSNPRDGFPPTHFPGVRLRPLGHVSLSSLLYNFIKFVKGIKYHAASINKMNIYTPVLFAFLFYFSKAH